MKQKDIELMIRNMEQVSVTITGEKVQVINIPLKDGLAYSIRNQVTQNLIAICFNYPFEGLTEDESKIILYGLYAHELMHIIRTDFDYLNASISKYPANERVARKKIWNIMEDPSVEFFSKIELSSFLHDCLMKTISYFFKLAPDLSTCKNAYNEFISAMIMFGDIGYLKGDFSFAESRDCFIKCAPIALEIIEEPDAKKRFDRSQEIFEIAKPLWEKQENDILANMTLEDLLKRFGLTLSFGDGNSISNADGNTELSEISKRRKKVIHLITEKQAKEKFSSDLDKHSDSSLDISDASDIYATEGDSEDGVVLPINDDYIIIDERNDKTESDKSGGGSAKQAQVQTGQTQSDNPSGLSLNEMIGKEIKTLSNSMQKEAKEAHEGDISRQDIDTLNNRLSSLENSQKKSSNKNNSEELQIEVRTPYSKTVKYQCEKIMASDDAAERVRYNGLLVPIQRHIINFTSNLKKVFRSYSQKEYSTSGRINTNRLTGQKVTARIFNKRKKENDKTDLALTLLIDQSGSMRTNIKNVKQVCILLLESFSKFDIPIKVIGFDTRGSIPIYYHYGDWENDQKKRQSITSMNALGGTFLGHAIRYAGCFLKKRHEKHKIFIVITDGQPECSIYQDKQHAMNDCRYAVSDIKKIADVIGIGIFKTEKERNDFRFIFRENSISMTDTNTLIKELPKMIGNIIKKY